ncbi:MAG: hypothetical protein RMJ07_04235 [Nitrososphaerota archaeon]|nr:hypothetical protein [Candidatus Bathyarchaeota archaeon]MDW8048872.1 hypothetical protein [Nitrososphaerota archaeon]
MARELSLGVVLSGLFMLLFGLFRVTIQLYMVNFDLGVFFRPPFDPLIPLSICIIYVVSGIIIFLSWPIGRVIAAFAIIINILVDFGKAISIYGLDVFLNLLLIYLLDLIVLAYLIYSSLQGEEKEEDF